MSSGINIDITANLTRFSSNLDRATQDLNRFQTNSQRISSSLRNSLGGLAAAFGLQQVGSALINRVEQVQNLDLRLRGLTKSATDYAETEAYLSKISAEHHKNILNLTDSYSRLLSVEESGVITRKQTQAIFEGLSNAQSKTGASADQMGQSMIGLGQALSMGTLQWEEMKQVTEPLPGLMMKIANAAGYVGESAVGDFKKVVSNGQVTSKMFGEILPIALETYSGAAAKASENITAKYADIENSWTSLAKALEAPVSSTVGAVLDSATWQMKEFVKQANYAKYIWEYTKYSIFGDPVTGGTGDNGMAVDLTGRAKPPTVKPDGRSKKIRSKIEGTKKTGASGTKKTALSEEQKSVNALAKEYDNLVASLSKEVALRGDNTEAARIEYEIINGSLSGLNESQKLKLLNLAAEKDAIEINKKAYEEYDQVIQDGLDLAKKQRLEMDAEQSRLDQKFNGKRIDFGAGISDAMDARAAGIIPNDAKLKEVLDGMGREYNGLTEKAQSSTDVMTEYAVQAARNMQSAFADFLFDPFAKGADSMLDSFVNVIRQMAAQAASAQIMQGLFGATGVKDGGGLMGQAATGLMAMFHHDGGIVGQGGSAGMVNAGIFSGAPRYHSGGVAGLKPDEVPAILQKGELVISRKQMANAQSGGGDITVNTSVSVSGGSGDNNAMQGLGNLINSKIREVLVTEKRPGGILA